MISSNTAATNCAARPLKIMVVDDVDFNLEILTPLLTERGAQIITAGSGEEALAKLAINLDVGLVLMDIGLPGISGIEAAESIRQDPATACIPIIALTAEIENLDLTALEQAGIQGHLEKNFDPDQLWQQINQTILSFADCRCQASEPAKTKPSAAQLLHYDHLLETFGSQEVVRQVAIAFFKDTAQQLDAIEQSINASDIKKLAETCHSLKGSANLFSADQLAEAAEELYYSARSACCEKLKSQFTLTKNSFTTLRNFVNDKLDLSL